MIQELLGGGKDINIFSSITFASSSAKTCPTPTTQVDSKTTLPANTSNSTSVTNNAKNNDRNNNSEMNNQKLRCPRCESTNTKFCYYNNYNLTQPRHFCKTCRRYWTKGGTLRNVPIGGGCRKNKIISSSTTSYPSSSSLSISPFTNSSLDAISHSAKCPLSTKLLFPDLIGKVVLDPQSDISNPTFWPPQPSHNSHTRAFLNANANPTQGLFDPYSANGAPTLLGSSSFLRSHQHQVLNGLASQDNRNIMELYQKLKPPRGYENPGQLISENVIGSSSLSPSPSSSSPISIGSTALREGGSGENLGIPSWPAQFSTLPMNGAYYP